MSDVICKETKKGVLYEVVPEKTYFVAHYGDGVVKGTGLDVTGWDNLKDGIIKLQYVLSTGKVIDIPRYEKYLHLVEASMSIDKTTSELYSKNYHYVYIKGYTGSNTLTHRILLRAFDKEDIGKVEVIVEGGSEIDNYPNAWKRGVLWH